jgi:hypothetical protein
MQRICYLGILGLMLGWITGCNTQAPPEIVPAEGIVLLNGKPLAKAQVRFIPTMDVGPEFIATAITDEQGKFKLESNGQSGAAVGEHLVAVCESDPPQELLSESKQRELAVYLRSLQNRPIPPNYGSPVGSGLSATIAKDGAPIELKLKR